jgi:Protein of unknown function (DUF3297)
LKGFTLGIKGASMNDSTPETTPATSGPDVPPDHLSVNPRSPFFDGELLRRGVGIRFKGVNRIDIEEYSISESWVRVQVGKTVNRKGQPLTIRINGPVEAWFEDLGDNAPVARRD